MALRSHARKTPAIGHRHCTGPHDLTDPTHAVLSHLRLTLEDGDAYCRPRAQRGTIHLHDRQIADLQWGATTFDEPILKGVRHGSMRRNCVRRSAGVCCEVPLPQSRSKLRDARCRVLADALQNVREVGIHINAVKRACEDERLNDANMLGAELRPAEAPIFASSG
jgi:hypothetical protein